MLQKSDCLTTSAVKSSPKHNPSETRGDRNNVKLLAVFTVVLKSRSVLIGRGSEWWSSSRSTQHSIILDMISGVAYTRSMQLDDSPPSRVIVAFRRHPSSSAKRFVFRTWLRYIVAFDSSILRESPATLFLYLEAIQDP